MDACPRRNSICSISPPLLWQSFAQVLRRSWGAICSRPAFSQQFLTTYQTTILRDAFSPDLSGPCHSAEDSAPINSCRNYPEVECQLCPVRNRHGPNVATLPD